MIRRFPLLRPSIRSGRAGFTLIELLTVIAIILVLAGLLLNVAGSANYKSSVARATAEVKAMETALESYKADNGAYPRTPTVGSGTDALNAQTDNDPNGSAQANYLAAGKILYEALSGTPASGSTTYGKKYMEFKPGQLGDANGSSITTGTTNPGANTLVVDPFGMAYGYSTALLYQNEKAQAATPPTAPPTTYGYNPTFDLWSCAGYGSGGKSYTKTGLDSTKYNTIWAKNW